MACISTRRRTTRPSVPWFVRTSGSMIVAAFACLFAIGIGAVGGLLAQSPMVAPAEEPAAQPANLIVAAIRDANPQTPTDLARAVRVLVDAREWAEAKHYLQLLLDGRTDAEAAAQIDRVYGPAFLVELSLTESLQPEGGRWAEFVRGAIRQLGENPSWVDQQLESCREPSTRAAALRALLQVHQYAWPRLLEVLADPDRHELHEVIEQLLADGGEPAKELLLAAVESDKVPLAIAASQLLVKLALRAPEVRLTLWALALRDDSPEALRGPLRQLCETAWGALPHKEALSRWLEEDFRRLFRQTPGQLPPVEQERDTWMWDSSAQRMVIRRVQPSQRQRWLAWQRAKQLLGLRPGESRFALYVEAARREYQQFEHGLGIRIDEANGVADMALEAAQVEQLLEFALQMGRAGAATWAARRLGQVGSLQHVRSSDGRTPALIKATQFPEQHVQFAAVEAIMRIQPSMPFAGSAQWRDLIGYFLNSRPTRRALVGNPSLEEGQIWAGLLRQMGMEVDLVSDGKSVLEQLARVPDYDFVLVVDRLSRPGVDETVQWAQAAPRGSQMRFAVLVHGTDLERWRLWAEEYPTVLVFPRVFSAEAMRTLIDQLELLPGRRPPPVEERVERTGGLLEWLAFAAADPKRDFLELMRLEPSILALSESPVHGVQAVAVLGALGTAAAQRQLVDLAGQSGLPEALRRAAAQAFHTAVHQRGLLLNSGEIRLQYDRYNRTAPVDATNQQILGSLLDVIEQGRQPRLTR